ncbi:hypothetical protein evm_011189 [Chilo suppressalis]|nr:hypothetical protein evm_011189 [Chilo suppressalis]
MAAKLDQKAYLQRYLGGGSSVDKKKKKKKVTKGNGFKIIDDDIDLTKLRPLDGDELDVLDQGEDGPQIAGIIDERPEEVKKLEQFKTSSKWRVVTQDDGFHSKLQIEEIKRDVKEAQKENELIFGKMYSDSEDEKQNDSDLSPPRIRPTDKSNNRETKKKQQNNSDSDFSPPRKGRESPSRHKKDQDNDSDISPPRKGSSSTGKEHRSRKPSRWGDIRSMSKSPSPKRSKYPHKKSSHKGKKSRSLSSDLSPHRPSGSQKYKSSQQTSKKESVVRNRSPSNSTHQKRYASYEFETGTSRNRDDRHRFNERKQYKELENRQQHSKDDDSDLSPPRKNNSKSESPPRKSSKHNVVKNTVKRKRDSSSDMSPPRRDSSRNTRETEKNYKGRSRDSPPPSNKKMEKTLDGKKAGLQDAGQLREENAAFRRREDDAFNKMADEVSGRNATAVSRKASKRDTSEERRKQKEKAERQKELDEKYKKWSKGLKQIEAQEARMQDFMHEASKPLARHKNDRDLENSLKDVLRDGDPMLQYIMDKKRERGDLGPEKPIYKGKFPPNRFNIRPGYRWDGVDRSNGYEKKYFEQQSKRKAQEEEAYKWSTEDL